MNDIVIQISYLFAGALFILALKWMSGPKTARRGVWAGEIGMLIAVIGTLLKAEVITYEWILVGLFIGSAIGVPMAVFMPMTAMPQRIALSHAFGALAAALVGTAEFYLGGPHLDRLTMGALSIEVILGFLTFTGSLMAFGKLQEILPGRPITYRGQNIVNLSILGLAILLAILLNFDPSRVYLFPIISIFSLLFGILLIIPIGGADMPTVISLLNSYAGLSGAAMGFVLNNKVLIIAGALDGSSGLLLSIIMCRAMNRSFSNVLFGAFGQVEERAQGEVAKRSVRSGTAEDIAALIAYARNVIFVPGYGMAAAQAQHAVRELADELTARGVEVKYAIHPVAGRMPGHMNVLLAEADVPYTQLFDMEAINPEFDRTDVAVVIGANDVVNPAARDQKGSPIYGMPILNVDRAKHVVIIKRGMSPGFAGIDNELFYNEKTIMLFGGAKEMASALTQAMKKV